MTDPVLERIKVVDLSPNDYIFVKVPQGTADQVRPALVKIFKEHASRVIVHDLPFEMAKVKFRDSLRVIK